MVTVGILDNQISKMPPYGGMHDRNSPLLVVIWHDFMSIMLISAVTLKFRILRLVSATWIYVRFVSQ